MSVIYPGLRCNVCGEEFGGHGYTDDQTRTADEWRARAVRFGGWTTTTVVTTAHGVQTLDLCGDCAPPKAKPKRARRPS